MRKIAEDVANTPMGNSPVERSYRRRLFKWLAIFFMAGLVIGMILLEILK